MEQNKSTGIIDEATFRRMTEAYNMANKDLNSDKTRSVYFRKSEHDKFLSFLQDENCAGLEVFFGVNEEGQTTVILAGIDTKGNLMINTLTNHGLSCPLNCGRP